MSREELIRKQLDAAAACIAAALAMLDPAPDPGPAEPCSHPERKRQSYPVSGDPGQFLCTVCHTLVPGDSAPRAVEAS